MTFEKLLSEKLARDAIKMIKQDALVNDEILIKTLQMLMLDFYLEILKNNQTKK